MTRFVDSGANRWNAAGNPGRCFSVHRQHGLDPVFGVVAKALLNSLRVDPVTPVSFQPLNFKAQFFGDIFPQSGEMAGFRCENPIAGRQTVE